MTKKMTVKSIQQIYQSDRSLVCLTAYDSQMARLVDEAGVDLILVGDSLGMTLLGYETTVPVTMEQMVHHAAAVVRGTKRAFVVADMPFMSYQVSEEQAMRNAARLMQEAGVDAVKLEGGETMAPTINRLTTAGVPVVAHIGLLPQHVLKEGGYRKYGKTAEEADQLLLDAQAVEAAGALAVVIEGVESEVATRITQKLNIPTIGIAAGEGCSGQIQVIHDILGLFESFVPKHAKRYINGAELIGGALKQYCQEVSRGDFRPDGQ